jgi:hypothetical protein
LNRVWVQLESGAFHDSIVKDLSMAGRCNVDKVGELLWMFSLGQKFCFAWCSNTGKNF